MAAPGTLFLIPVPISSPSDLVHIPSHNLEVVRSLRYFIVEDEKSARRHLKAFGYPNLPDAQLSLLNEHSKAADAHALLLPLRQGHDVGLMSDAGCPAVADPGSEVVALCHRSGFPVVPLAGPSSILFAVMCSGFSGQNFAFVGYLPVDKSARARRLKDLEQAVYRNRQAQFFIETPYRNGQLLETALSVLQPATKLFLGASLGTTGQTVAAKTVGEWKKEGVPRLLKQPVVFGIFG